MFWGYSVATIEEFAGESRRKPGDGPCCGFGGGSGESSGRGWGDGGGFGYGSGRGLVDGSGRGWGDGCCFDDGYGRGWCVGEDS